MANQVTGTSVYPGINRREFYNTEVPLYSPATALPFRFALVVHLVRPSTIANLAGL